MAKNYSTNSSINILISRQSADLFYDIYFDGSLSIKRVYMFVINCIDMILYFVLLLDLMYTKFVLFVHE
jgi:hypothetical protein